SSPPQASCRRRNGPPAASLVSPAPHAAANGVADPRSPAPVVAALSWFRSSGGLGLPTWSGSFANAYQGCRVATCNACLTGLSLGLGHPPALGQLVGEPQVLFVSVRPHVVVFQRGERLQQVALVFLRQGLLGHREQAVVLLGDVFAEESDVGPGVHDKLKD